MTNQTNPTPVPSTLTAARRNPECARVKNTIDITDMTDAALDVVLAARSGADHVSCEHLTAKERYQVAEALGWEMNAATRYWIDSTPSAAPSKRSIDYEGAILDEQEDFCS